MKSFTILGYTVRYSLVLSITKQPKWMDDVLEEAKTSRLRETRLWRQYNKDITLLDMVKVINPIYYKYNPKQ